MIKKHYRIHTSRQAIPNSKVSKCVFFRLEKTTLCELRPWNVEISICNRITDARTLTRHAIVLYGHLLSK